MWYLQNLCNIKKGYGICVEFSNYRKFFSNFRANSRPDCFKLLSNKVREDYELSTDFKLTDLCSPM